MNNWTTRWYTIVDEMSVEEMSVDEMSVDELSRNRIFPCKQSYIPKTEYILNVHFSEYR